MKHTITEEDLIENPDLKEQGLTAGEEVEFDNYLTQNEKDIADGAVTALKFAIQRLPSSKGKALVEYITASLAEDDDTPITIEELINGARKLSVGICKETEAENVAELMSDLADAAVAGEQGKIGIVIGKLFEIGHDFSVIKRKGK